MFPNIVFAATPYDGTLAPLLPKFHFQNAYHLPENLTLEDGAMVSEQPCNTHTF